MMTNKVDGLHDLFDDTILIDFMAAVFPDRLRRIFGQNYEDRDLQENRCK